MKTFYTLLATLCATATVLAQPVLHQANLPAVGYTVNAGSGPITQGPGGSGPNQSWDFSSATLTATGTFTVMQPDSTPYLIQYPTATVANRLLLGMDTEYTFFILTPDTLQILGENVNAFGGHNYLVNHKLELVFPYTYGNTFTDGWIQIGGMNGLETRVYDAYGQIKTPYGTFNNVVRQYYQRAPGVPVDYIWYRTDPVTPVFWIDSTNNRILAFDSLAATGVASVPSISDVAVYPNPGSGAFSVRSAVPVTRVRICNAAGAMVLEANEPVGNAVKTGALTPGLYVVTITDANGRERRSKLVVR